MTIARVMVMLLLVGSSAAPARADIAAAKEHHKKGLSHYALGEFAEAAVEYEAAFELEPDAAFLYNAAVAHRQAGHKVRALALFQSFVRLFADHPNTPLAQRQAAALKTSIDEDRAKGIIDVDTTRVARKDTPKPTEAAAPSGATAAAENPGGVATPTRAALVVTQAPANVVATSAPPPEHRRSKRWVWGVVAGVAAVAIGVGVGVGVGLSGDKYPSPTAGSARVP
jgi:hypothetical protein